MTTETQLVRDTANFVEREPRSSFSSVLRETFRVNERCFVTPSYNIRETFYANDHYVQSAFSVLHDAARFRDAVYPNLTYHVSGIDAFYVRDAISAVNNARVDVRETARFASRALSPPAHTVHETFRVNDRLHWFSTGTIALRETFRVRDAAYPHNSVVLREVASFDDALSSHYRAVQVAREQAYFEDEAHPLARVRGDLHEVLYITDKDYPRLVGSGGGAVLHEIFYADDRAVPPASGRAFTCHIVNWGMSMYANYPFLTQSGNYAAGANLWRLDATKDHTKEIQSWFTTPRMDIGTSHGKRPSALYAAGSTLAPLTITVTGDVNGQLASYDYTLELRDQTNYRNNRTPLGKGFRSRYLQFRLQAGKYTAFRVLTAEVDLAASPRRVG